MIVRIATEGQYRLEDGQAAKLNELDNEIVAVVQSGDEDGFRGLFDQMLALARSFFSFSVSWSCWASSSLICGSRFCSSDCASVLRSSAARASSSLPAASA